MTDLNPGDPKHRICNTAFKHPRLCVFIDLVYIGNFCLRLIFAVWNKLKRKNIIFTGSRISRWEQRRDNIWFGNLKIIGQNLREMLSVLLVTYLVGKRLLVITGDKRKID
jgi:hypothetical protein